MDVQLSFAERRLLAALPAEGAVTAEEAAQRAGFGSVGEALRAAGAPQRHGLLELEEQRATTYTLSEEGRRHREAGLPERRAVQAVLDAGGRLPMAGLQEVLAPGEVPVAIGWLKRKGWARLEKDGGTFVVADGAPPPGPDEVLLERWQEGGPTGHDGAGGERGAPPGAAGDAGPDADAEAGLELLRGRGGVLVEQERTERRLSLTPAGRALAADLEVDNAREINAVTPDLLAQWREMDPEQRRSVHLRAFDFDVEVAPRLPAKPHPLTQMMERIRAVFLGLGFQEIRGDYVESAFWNMDALFIPQDHPAREEQDTFYLRRPDLLPVAEADLERGREVHEHGGGTGSTGWGGAWSAGVARQALLRTHTTNTTIRYLARNPEGAHKVFGLGRVFRNETMDATHLPEFHQIEGIVTEPGASFDMLVGLCRAFFGRMGFDQVRFRPAYFPYTEPSMEIDVHYQGRWMELGGCGVFRPEVTAPLGVAHPVLAWGFGLERLAMMRLGLKDIRQLYLSDVAWLQRTPLVE